MVLSSVPSPRAYLSLCTGGGGLDLGFRLANPSARPVCLVEGDAAAAELLATRMEEGTYDPAPLWSDLGSFDARPWLGAVDSVVAGIPCPAISVAGKRRGARDERWLWPGVRRILDECEPAWLFLENVPGIVSKGLEEIKDDLAQGGWAAEWDCFSAHAVADAPHERERFFLVAWHVSHAERLGLRLEPERDQREGRGVRAPERWHPKSLELGACVARPEDVFPPRSNDADAWRVVLDRLPERRPAAEPGLHGVAHGLADWAHRYRIVGNGVVPIVAAVAWRALWGRILSE